ncbi:MAG: tetratricopeptide repeat protein [Gemmataceae bacterium]|nr:tetratricopeptide repeat protein [Gemmataceae bacterium]
MRRLPWPPNLWKPIRRRPLLTATAAGVCLLVVGLGVYLRDQNSRAENLWRQAEQAIADRDFARAQQQLGAYLEMRPNSGEAHVLLAQAFRRARREDFGHARTHLAAARRLRWSAPAVDAELCLLDFQQHGSPDAREQCLHLLLNDPGVDQRPILEALARGCLRGDRLDDALRWLDRWVHGHPDDWYAYLWRGTLLQHMDKPAPAAADFAVALRWQPQSADVKQRLGLALVQSGSEYPKALRLLEDHRQSHPADADTLVGIARCHSVLQQPQAARALLQTVLADHPRHVDALLALALVEVDLENHSEALRWLRRLEPLAESPGSQERFQKLLRLEPVADNSSVPTRLRTVYHLLATVLRELGPEQEARAYEQKVIQLESDVIELLAVSREHARKPNDVALWHRLGVLSLRVGMKEAGEDWLRRVLHANPRDRSAHRALADYYRGRTDPESQRKADWHQRRARDDP